LRRHQSTAGIEHGDHRHLEPVWRRVLTGDDEHSAVELVAPAEPASQLSEELPWKTDLARGRHPASIAA
jgi:hypothetical protein